MKLRLSELIDFLKRAKINTFASDAPRLLPLRPPHSKNYAFDEPPFRYEDQYFGEYVDVGEEIVWFNGIPIWGMGYRGGTHAWAYPNHVKIFEFLREALRQPDPRLPVRGPMALARDPYFYTCSINGSLLAFTGTETVYFEGKPAAFRHFLGGLIRGKHNFNMEITQDIPLTLVGEEEAQDLARWQGVVPVNRC